MTGPYKYQHPKRITAASKIRQAFRDNPDASVSEVAKKYKTTMKIVYMYRDQVRRGMATATKPLLPTKEIYVGDAASLEGFDELMYKITQGRGGERTAPDEATPAGVDKTLDARAATYGRFIDVAETTQTLMHHVSGRLNDRGIAIVHDQALALYMICQKMARIANGDPNHADSWLDIAGYATLVAERLSGKAPR
tara:strand:- start:1272 stop:1856 length:585 start_codon:yes stop_codon:yes gene_type:complete